MNRPKKEDYIIQYSFSYGAWKEFDNESYEKALNVYIDKLDKTFNNCYDVLVGKKVYVPARNMNREQFRKWCMQNE